MASKKSNIFSQIGSYTASTYAAQLINVFGSVIAKFFLGPVNSGIWSALQLILDFSKYSGLGVNTVVNLDVPYYQAKGDHRRVDTIVSTVFSFLFLTSILIGTVVLIYAFVRADALSKQLFWGLIFVSGLILFQRLNNFFVTLLRAFRSFGTASRQNVYSALVNVALIGILASKFKIYGFLWAIGLSLAFNIFYIQWKEKYPIRFDFDAEVFKKTVSTGLPLMVLGIAETFFKSIDKFMLLKFFGFEALGLYSIGIMAANYLNSLHVSIAVVLLPHFQEKFGKNDSRSDLRDYFDKGLLGFSELFPPLIAFVWVLAPYATHLVLKEFAAGIPALKWIVLGIFFVSLGNLCSNYLITVKERARVLFALCASCLFALCLGVLAVNAGGRVEAIAAVSLASAWFYFTLLFRAALPEIYSAREAWKIYSEIMAKFLIMVLVLKSVDAFILLDGSSLIRTMLSFTIVAILSLPLVISLTRRLDLSDRIRSRFAGKK